MAVKKTAKKAVKTAAKSSTKAKAPAKKAAPVKKAVAAKKAVKPVAKAAKAVKPAAKPVAKTAKKVVKAPVKVAKKPVVAKAAAKKVAAAKPAAKVAKPAAKKAPAKKTAPVAKKAVAAPVKKAAPVVKAAAKAAKPATKQVAPAAAVKPAKPVAALAPVEVKVAAPAPAPAPAAAKVAKKPGRKTTHAPLDVAPRAPVPMPPRVRPVGKTLTAKAPTEKVAPKSSKVKVVKYDTDKETKRPILPPGYKPSVDEEYMNPLHIEYFRQKLLDRRAALVAESKQTIESLKEEVRDVGDDAERASRETENALELRERDRNRKMIGKLDSILRRIDNGDYGYCVDTGEEIGLERLEARPEAERTLDAQGRREHLQRQYSD